MKILIADSQDQTLHDLEILLIKTIGLSVIYEVKTSEIIRHIQSNKEIALIISRDVFGKENLYETITSEMEKLKISIPIIWRSVLPLKTTDIKFIEDSLEKNISQISNFLSEKITSKQKKESNFIAVKAEQFLSIESSQSSCDVYIKIENKDTGPKYLKRLHANNTFSKEEVQKYIIGGLKEFYVPADQYQEYVNMISVEIIRSLKNKKNENLDVFMLKSFAYDTALERLKLFGIVDDLTIHLAQETIKKITKSIEKNETLTNYMKHLKSSSSSFAFFHSFLIALLAERLAKAFDWYSAQARDKLVYLAYFHDISLSSSKLSIISSETDIEMYSLTDAERDSVMNHATRSAELLSNFKEIPFGLAQLVTEHHGSKKGFGFPENLNTSISPLAIMFMVLEDFSTAFIKYNIETAEDIQLIFEGLKNKYNHPTYTETLVSLKSIFPEISAKT